MEVYTKFIEKEMRVAKNDKTKVYAVYKTEDGQLMSAFDEPIIADLDKHMNENILIEMVEKNGYKNIRGFIRVAPGVTEEKLEPATPEPVVPQETKVLPEQVNDFGCKLRYKQLATGKLVIEVCGCKRESVEQTIKDSDELLAKALATIAASNKEVA